MITITDADGAVYHYGLLEDKAKVHEIVQRSSGRRHAGGRVPDQVRVSG